jgi:glycine/D-amino acid oxidase-like deaminating enzyme
MRDTVWDGRLDPAERAALRPGVPPDLPPTPDVLVVGGGVVGLAVAVACRRAGLGRVVVIERADRLASASSGSNSGAIAPDMHLMTDGPGFVAFGRTSRELYREWDADWGGALGLWPTRWLSLFPPGQAPAVTRGPPPPDPPVAGAVPDRAGLDRAGLDRAVPDRPVVPPELRMLDAAEVGALEPDVRLPEGGRAVLVEGQLGANPQRLVAALAGRAGQVATGLAARGVTVRGDRIVTVRTAAGDFAPGAVVLATGLLPPPWSAGVPQRWVKGHMLAVGPGPWRLGSVLAGPLGGGTPLADGSVVCGGTFDEEDASPAVRPEVADTLAAGLAAVLPATTGAAVTHRWCCFRPYIEGRQPVLDRLPGVANGWFAGGHFTTGVMMAAGTGAAVADWISGAAPPAGARGLDLPHLP